jgi:lipopolysaccharide transport system ATP-binding protein
LLIDEGIGAGDRAFQEKVQQRIDALFESASILVLATHSEELMDKYCKRRVELSRGVRPGA